MAEDKAPLPKKLVAVYASKSKKTVLIGEPASSALLQVRNTFASIDNFDIVSAMVAAYNEKYSEEEAGDE